MAQLFAHPDFPLPVVEGLRALQHDVLIQSSKRVLTDEAVLSVAVRFERALLVLHRKHFLRLHISNPYHKGIIVCTFDLDFGALTQRTHAVLLAHPDLSGLLLRVDHPKKAGDVSVLDATDEPEE